MRVVNPSKLGRLKMRETVGEYRVAVRPPLRGAGVVTRRRILTGKTLRPKTRLTAGIFQKKGSGPMRLQSLAFPKPTSADSARRKAGRITGRVVNTHATCTTKALRPVENPRGRSRKMRKVNPSISESDVDRVLTSDLFNMIRDSEYGVKLGFWNGLTAAFHLLKNTGHGKAANAVYLFAIDCTRRVPGGSKVG